MAKTLPAWTTTFTLLCRFRDIKQSIRTREEWSNAEEKKVAVAAGKSIIHGELFFIYNTIRFKWHLTMKLYTFRNGTIVELRE